MVAKSVAAQGAGKKKSGGGGGLFIVILVVGGGLAALHFTGKLKPLLDSFGKKEPAAPATVAPAPAETKTLPEPVKKVEPVKESVKKPEPEQVTKVEPVEKAVEEDALSQAYRKRFSPPKIGQPITLMLKGKVKKTGVLQYLDDKTVRLNTGKIEMTLSRNQLAAAGLARCYEDDYVRYMVALHKQKEEMEKMQQARIAKLNDAYAQFLKSRGKKVTKSTTYTANQSIDDVDFKKWMEENGQTELLKARQERIKAYEAQRMKEGRSY